MATLDRALVGMLAHRENADHAPDSERVQHSVRVVREPVEPTGGRQGRPGYRC